jgi:chromosome segregation ATPase
MLWLLGSLGFGAQTVMRYKEYLDDIQPRLKRAREAAEKLEKGIEVETTRKHADEEERAGVQKKMTELKSRTAEIRRSIGEGVKAQEELEMAMYKREFKKAK